MSSAGVGRCYGGSVLAESSSGQRCGARVALALFLSGGLGLFGAPAYARADERAVGARPAEASTTWTRVIAQCPSGWAREGSGCWDQRQTYGTWSVSDGSASVTGSSSSVTMNWSIPAQITGSGGQGSVAVMTTGGAAERICVLHVYTSFRLKGGGDTCAQSSASRPSAFATVDLLPKNAPVGSLAYVSLSLGGGGNLYYTYEAGPPSPAATLQSLSARSFDRTVVGLDPAPGGAALISSPLLAGFGAARSPVSGDIEGLTKNDQLILSARRQCYASFATSLARWLRGPSKNRSEAELLQEDYGRWIRVRGVTPHLAGCLGLGDFLEQRLGSPAADVAKASCVITAVTVSITGSGPSSRVRFVRVENRPPLKVSCVRTGGGIRMTVSTRSRPPLRKLAGPRLQLVMLQSNRDSRGGELSATFHHG